MTRLSPEVLTEAQAVRDAFGACPDAVWARSADSRPYLEQKELPMSLHCVFPGSRSEPAEYVPTEPVECIVCGWVGDAEDHEGEYLALRDIPRSYLWAMSGDVICRDCSLFCADCGEDLLDGGIFAGAWSDGSALYCWHCVEEALCPTSI